MFKLNGIKPEVMMRLRKLAILSGRSVREVAISFLSDDSRINRAKQRDISGLK